MAINAQLHVRGQDTHLMRFVVTDWTGHNQLLSLGSRHRAIIFSFACEVLKKQELATELKRRAPTGHMEKPRGRPLVVNCGTRSFFYAYLLIKTRKTKSAELKKKIKSNQVMAETEIKLKRIVFVFYNL